MAQFFFLARRERGKKMGRSQFPDTGGARIEDIEEKEMAEIFGQKQEVF